MEYREMEKECRVCAAIEATMIRGRCCRLRGGANYVLGNVITEGSYLNAGHKKRSLSPGSLFLIKPGEVDAVICAKQGFISRILYVPASLFGEICMIITGIKNSPEFDIVNCVDGELGKLYHRLYSSLIMPANTAPTEREEALIEFMERFIRDHSDLRVAKENNRQKMQEIRSFIQQNYRGQITLDKLCAIFNLTKECIVFSFIRVFGISPHAYLMSARVSESQRLLKHGLTLKEAAQKSGFIDAAHFCEQFESVIGVNPKAYRSAHFN